VERAIITVFALVAGCVAAPDLGSGDFLCAQEPKVCPEGRICVGDRCVLPGGADASVGPDGAPPSRFRRPLVASSDSSASDIPVLVILNPDRINYSESQPDGRDVFFLDSTGTRLAHEIERWQPGGESLVWVRLPALQDGATVYLHYGGDDVSENSAAVWQDFDLVYHFDGDAADSSPRGYSGTLEGAASAGGRLGGGLEFDGVDDLVRTPVNADLFRGAAGASISCWINRSPTVGSAFVEIANSTGDSSRAFLTQISAGRLRFGVRPTDEQAVVTSNDAEPITDGQWQWILGTADLSAKRLDLYVDGQLVDSVLDPTLPATTVDQPSAFAILGHDDINLNNPFDGLLDEIRISSRARNADWAAVQYAAMTDSLFAFGAEELVP